VSGGLSCSEVRPLAPDVALDLLAGAERAAALDHLAGCAGCRLEVEELSSVADSLLALGPEVAPSPGFEAAVLARMEAEQAPLSPGEAPAAGRRRRWVRPLLVAACLALGAGLLLGAPRPDPGVRRATFIAADGRPAGEVVITEGDPDHMTCTVDHSRFTGAYTVELVLRDGTRREVGGFDVQDGGAAWATPLPVDDDRIAAVEVLSPDGEVRSEAEL
jgi:hypothetical protein